MIDQVVSKVAVLFHGGTSGSNPASSSGEWGANLTFPRRKAARGQADGHHWFSHPSKLIPSG